jgi:hypothetical protein
VNPHHARRGVAEEKEFWKILPIPSCQLSHFVFIVQRYEAFRHLEALVQLSGETMTHQAVQLPVRACRMIVAMLVLSTALAGSPAGSSSEPKKDKTEKGAGANADEQSRREAEQLVRGIEPEILSGDKRTKVERIDKPLLYYSEPTRNNDRGGVWGWGPKGRPVALLELFQDTNDRTRWVFAVCNTSGGKLRARRADAPWWRENDSATEVKDIPGAPVPPADTALRQRQLKLLAQKFTGHEFWDPDNTRYELRRLTQPLCTYQDKAGGILDGGLFALANGTNPEIMVFVEARVDPKNSAKPVWQYAVGRLAHAELHLEYDGKEVFQAPRGDKVSASNAPYWLGLMSAALEVDPRKP